MEQTDNKKNKLILLNQTAPRRRGEEKETLKGSIREWNVIKDTLPSLSESFKQCRNTQEPVFIVKDKEDDVVIVPTDQYKLLEAQAKFGQRLAEAVKFRMILRNEKPKSEEDMIYYLENCD